MMKVQICFCFEVMLFFTVVLFSSLSFASGLYDNDVINTIQMKFGDDNWDADLDGLYQKDYDGDGEYDRLSCTVIINEVQYDQVGVRYKGNSSYSAGNAKNPFNIKLDDVVEQYYEGYGTLKLSNVFKDPSFVRETLSYEIARKYMDASQANYMNVYIYNHSTGQYDYHGLYTNVEAVDKKFLSEHFYSNDNARFKCNGSDTWSPTSGGTGSSIDYLGSDPSLYYDYYQLKSDDPNHWDNLVNLAYNLEYNSQNFDDAVDLDRAIWMLAFDNVLVNLDSYIGPSRQNYYLYEGNDQRWITVLWDLNESFGAFSMIDSGGRPTGPGHPGESTPLDEMDPLLRDGDDGWPLLNIIFGNSTYKKMYIAHMRTILEENFSNEWYETRALEIQNVIDSTVQSDTNKFYSYSDFINNIDYTCQGSIGITELMDSRVNYLSTQSSFTATAPVIGNIVLSPEEPSTNSSVWINSEVSNANLVKLAYRNSSTGKFTKIQMFDDGNNNDGSSGDGTYGVSLSIANTDIEYYIYAENNIAAVFSPERAEHEFYVIDVSPTSLVINEFMAENDTTIQDPDGGVGYPDWLELYNPSANTIDLGGMYLTDNLSESTQCQIPSGVSIEPYGHLLFWADKDTEQGDTHLNLKLSRTGEEIGLFDTDANGNVLIDSITFGLQTANISFGRIGDGDDNWQEINCPSPGSANPSIADLDGNCIVNLADFASLAQHWMEVNCGDCSGTDITRDGNVNLDDLIEFIDNWFEGV
ncbi:MAG: CotH kinase family protein [Phycisphaerae bacterium]|nr:CotH kinase family protein [Phycisphaerae bacterium]